MLRGAFGLLSLLIAVAIVAYLWAENTRTVTVAGHQVHDQAEQLSGRSADGTPVDKSITTEPVLDQQRHLKALLVKDVVPGAGMDTFYGLKAGDRITTLESLSVDMNDDAGLAQAMLVDSYQKKQPIVVIREGHQITLPLTTPPPGINSTPAVVPQTVPPTDGGSATSRPANKPHEGGSIQDQLNRIRTSEEQQ